MSTPQDTTTVLNVGAGGDAMDESLITQAGTGAPTVAKRPRVVIAGDASGAAVCDPVNADPGASPYSLPALGLSLVSDNAPANYTDGELRPLSLAPVGSLRVVVDLVHGEPDFFGAVPAFGGEVEYANYSISGLYH